MKTILMLTALILLGAVFFFARASFTDSALQNSPLYDESNVLVGEYPDKTDFKALKAHGVARVLSLLNSKDPEELALNQREKMKANNYGIQYLNVPMTSSISCSLEPPYHHQARLAVKTIRQEDTKIYVHSDSDMRRVAEVEKYMHGWGNPTYVPSHQAHQSEDQQRIARITLAFYSKRYGAALSLIDQGPPPTEWLLVLRGWCHYHLGEYDEAKDDFMASLKKSPRSKEPLDGIGYCELQLNRLNDAEAAFMEVLHSDHEDCQALTGMAYVRYRQGRIKEARMYLKKALASNPDDYDALQLAKIIGLDTKRTALLHH